MNDGTFASDSNRSAKRLVEDIFITKIRKYENTREIHPIPFVISYFQAFVINRVAGESPGCALSPFRVFAICIREDV